MLTFDSISKIYQSELFAKKVHALENVSFNVPEGKITGFLGANGAGKTTSLKIAMGLIKATNGKCLFAARLGKTKKEIFSKIAFLPERPYFYPHLTGLEFVDFMGKLNHIKKSEIITKRDQWAKRFNISHALDRKLQTYSKGMLQRLGFVVTMLHDPEFIILDEPISGLDPIGRKEIKEAIAEVGRSGRTIFFSSHIVPDVEEICSSVIFLEKGKLIYQGPIDKLILQNVRPDFSITFFDDKNQYTGKDFSNLSPNIYEINIPVDLKEKKLSELIEKQAKILSVQQTKLSLEEIFYKIRS